MPFGEPLEAMLISAQARVDLVGAMRFVIRAARAGSVIDTTTMKIGIAMSARKVVNSVWLTSNSQTLPARMPLMTPGLKKAKMST